MGLLITVIACAATTPAGPDARAWIGASTLRLPRRRFVSACVSNCAAGGLAVVTRVPAGMKMSAGEGVERKNTTLPMANVAVRLSTPTSSPIWSRSRPVAVSTKLAV